MRNTNSIGETALHYASRLHKKQLHFPGEDQKIISLLMENGSDVFMQTSTEQETVFHYCAAEGNVAVLREILSHLHSGQIQLAANKQSSNGWSPLIVAASKGHTETAMVSQIRDLQSFHHLPANLASLHLISPLTQLFLENNGRVDVFDHQGRSALHLAAENGSIEVCEALLQRNAFINSKTKTGWTSLHYSAMKGYTQLVDFLVKKHNATIDSMTIVSASEKYLF